MKGVGTTAALTVCMATNKTSGMKKLSLTVGDLIAAAFDVVGDQVDQVVDLLRYDGMRKRASVVVEVPSETNKRI